MTDALWARLDELAQEVRTIADDLNALEQQVLRLIPHPTSNTTESAWVPDVDEDRDIYGGPV